MAAAAPFCVADVEKHLRTTSVGRRLFYKDVTETTMDDAERGARVDGCPHGTAYVAGIQTNARGSKGRKWEAKDSGNLYASFIIHRQKDKDEDQTDADDSMEYDVDVTGALAVIQVLQDMKVAGVAAKWLNDLVVNGHKLLGTLAEYKGPITVDGEEKWLYILGIGLNVNADVRRHDLHPIATSIRCETGRDWCRETIFAEIANQLEEYLSLDRTALHEVYDQNAVFEVGQEVKVYCADGGMQPRVAAYMGVQDDWSVKLSDADGGYTAWSCEQVSIRRHTKYSVYVYRGRRGRHWSARLLMNTLSAVVNMSTYEVKYISDEQLNQGIPSDCILLAVGELTDDCCWGDFTESLRAFVEAGRAFFGVGTGCLAYFQKHHAPSTGDERKLKLYSSHVVDEMLYQGDTDDDDKDEDEGDDDGEVKYDTLYTTSANQVNIVAYLENELKTCAKDVNVMSYRDETATEDDIVCTKGPHYTATDPPHTERMKVETGQLPNELAKIGALCALTPGLLEHTVTRSKESPNAQPELKAIHGRQTIDDVHGEVMDSSTVVEPSSEVNDRMTRIVPVGSACAATAASVESRETHDHSSTVDGKDKPAIWREPKSGCKPDIVTFGYGSGFVCLCSPNIEVTYADSDVLSGMTVADVERLQYTVFKRDNLVRLVLLYLGL